MSNYLAGAAMAAMLLSSGVATAETVQKLPLMAGLTWSVHETQECVLQSPVIGGEIVTAIQLSGSAYKNEVNSLKLVLAEPPTKRAVSKVGMKIGAAPARAVRASPSLFQSGQLWTIYLNPDETAAINAGKPAVIGMPDEVIQLVTRTMALKLPALRDCERTRLAASVKNPPPLDAIEVGPDLKTLLKLFQTNDYPPSALRSAQEGRVVVTLRIDQRGKVSECAVTVSSNSRALDDATCSIIRSRAKFEPAQDKSGNKVASLTSAGIAWWLP